MVTSDINAICSKLNSSFPYNPSPIIQLINTNIYLASWYLTGPGGGVGTVWKTSLSIYTRMHVFVYLTICSFKTTLLVLEITRIRKGRKQQNERAVPGTLDS